MQHYKIIYLFTCSAPSDNEKKTKDAVCKYMDENETSYSLKTIKLILGNLFNLAHLSRSYSALPDSKLLISILPRTQRWIVNTYLGSLILTLRNITSWSGNEQALDT